MLFLVLAHWYEIALIKQYISGHENGVSKKSHIGGEPFGEFILVAVSPFHESDGSNVAEIP